MKSHPGLKYKQKQQNADLLLKNYVYKKIFRVWTKLTRRVRFFRRRKNQRILSKVIDAWQAKS